MSDITFTVDACSDVSTSSCIRNDGFEYQIDLFVCTGTYHDAFIIGCTANVDDDVFKMFKWCTCLN